MADKHVADAESRFIVVNVTPDFCRVDGKVVPFEIYQRLPAERVAYSPNCFARGKKILTVGSVVGGTIGNTGAGVLSGVSGADGCAIVETGNPTVFVNGRAAARHDDVVIMNVSR